MEYTKEEAIQDWENLIDKVNKAEDKFKYKLQRAITLSVLSSNVEIKFDRKQFVSAYEKCLSKNCKITDLKDILRAAILYGRKVDPEKILRGIEKVFGRGSLVKVDRREVPREGSEYFGAIHVDIEVDGLICEVQIMRKNLWAYKQESKDFYKDPSGKRITDLPERDKNIQKMWFERANKPQDIKLDPARNYEIELEAAINLFYKIAISLK